MPSYSYDEGEYYEMKEALERIDSARGNLTMANDRYEEVADQIEGAYEDAIDLLVDYMNNIINALNENTEKTMGEVQAKTDTLPSLLQESKERLSYREELLKEIEELEKGLVY
jgi:hypothetical protein